GFTMTADLELPAGDVTGPVFAAGGHLGGMALYLRDGKPVFALNTIAGEATEIAADEALPAGEARISLEFARPRGAGDARVAIAADGRVLATGSVPEERLRSFFVFELFGVGLDGGTPVLAGAKPDQPFPGGIANVTFDFNLPA